MTKSNFELDLQRLQQEFKSDKGMKNMNAAVIMKSKIDIY
jgi:hypothetical protein